LAGSPASLTTKLALIAAASLSPDISNPFVDNSGALDPGLDGALDEPSDRDVTLDLVANAIGTHIISITGEYADGTDVLAFQQDAISTVHATERLAGAVPESNAVLGFSLGTLIAAASCYVVRDSRRLAYRTISMWRAAGIKTLVIERGSDE
jgi:hypothetical protein